MDSEPSQGDLIGLSNKSFLAKHTWHLPASENSLSNEQRATKIIKIIRENERNALFGNLASEAIPGPDTLDMGGQFLTNKDRFESRGKLFETVRAMPKGALLHLHFNAELAPDKLMEAVPDSEHLYIRSTKPIITRQDWEDSEIVFNVLPGPPLTGNIFDTNYDPHFKPPKGHPDGQTDPIRCWMKWSDFTKQFQARNDKPTDTVGAWIKRKLAFDEREVYDATKTTSGVWDRFNRATRVFKGLMNYESIFKYYAKESVNALLSDLTKDTKRIFEIPSIVGGRAINALGDSGAKHNFMNESFARQLGLHINRQDVRTVKIGSGQKVKTAGSVSTTFRFNGEQTLHHIIFQLLPNCVQDVILSKTFMKATQTLTKFSHRIKERLVSVFSNPHMLYLGASNPMFEGYINSMPQMALGDTGAKVPILDEEYARSLGIKILDGKEHQTRLRFADGSTVLTSGMAYNVEWKYGDSETPYFLDFHILPNAPASVILCDTFLYDTKAFQLHEECLIDDDDEDDYSHCFAIDKDAGYQAQKDIANLSLADRRLLETVRRGEAQDRIDRLPEHEREVAETKEKQKQQEWQRQMDSLLAGHEQVQQISVCQSLSMRSTNLGLVSKKRFKWFRFKKARPAKGAVAGAGAAVTVDTQPACRIQYKGLGVRQS